MFFFADAGADANGGGERRRRSSCWPTGRGRRWGALDAVSRATQAAKPPVAVPLLLQMLPLLQGLRLLLQVLKERENDDNNNKEREGRPSHHDDDKHERPHLSLSWFPIFILVAKTVVQSGTVVFIFMFGIVSTFCKRFFF